MFPRIIAGSSVGALSAAAIAGHKYADLWEIFNKDYGLITAENLGYLQNSYLDALKALMTGNPVLSTETLKNSIKLYVGDMTFLEIYE